MQVENVWPTTLQEKDRINLNDFFSLSTRIASLLSHTVETFLQEMYNKQDSSRNNHESIFSNIANDGDTISLMRLFHYFPINETEKGQDKAILGSSPHTDWGYLTIILQDNVGRL